MLAEIGVASEEEFYNEIPESLRLRRRLNLPEPFLAERELKRHTENILLKNSSCDEYLSFLGAGCYQHHVPTVCDEINQRSEFLTAYAGEPYDDHGRFQALFEYASMMGELLTMDVVNIPTYDGLQAAATSIRMAARITGRREVLVASTIHPAVLSKIRDYCGPSFKIYSLAYDVRTGELDLSALRNGISEKTAAVYFENPSYLGQLEARGNEISEIAHEHGTLCVVGTDPISLGVISPPAEYGADIVCGDIQSLGVHMQFGGGHAGFIATRDEREYIMEYPSRLFGIAPTHVEGEYGFGDVAYERTSFAEREEGVEFVGTGSALWGVTAGVYLALMGPQGMRELGEGILQRTAYLMKRVSTIDGISVPFSAGHHFCEFVVRFNGTGKTVEEINRALMSRAIFGGKDISREFPELGECALYCVTEVHTKSDLDRLCESLAEVVS
jgi:glycine dehydrogenase subunit 1